MKKKLEHIWYYYKWYILAAALVLLVAANFIGEVDLLFLGHKAAASAGRRGQHCDHLSGAGGNGRGNPDAV